MSASISLLGGFRQPAAQPAPDAGVEGVIEALVQVIYTPQTPELELPLPLMDMPVEPVQSQNLEEQAPAVEVLADPQQWLLMMLNQQAVNVQARDSNAASAPPPSTARVLTRLAADAGVLQGLNEPTPLPDAPLTLNRTTQGEPMALSLDPQALAAAREGAGATTPVKTAVTAVPAEGQWAGIAKPGLVSSERADATLTRR